jgi:hypothetical protein
MNKFLLSAIVLAGLLAVAVVIGSVWGISTYNQASSLKNLYDAKLKANNASFDNMFKTIDQSAQVTNKQKDALKEIFTSYASARTTGGSADGSVMKWVTESIPNVDTSVYKTLMNTITSARDSWTMRQLELVDIARQYNQYLVQFPTNVFLKMLGFEKIDAKVVTSGRTEKAFETGRDDDTKLP